MSKIKGSYKSSLTIEVESNAPLDPRTIWKSWEEIADIRNWPQLNGKPYCYNGLIAYIGNDVYVMVDENNWGNQNGWEKLQKNSSSNTDVEVINSRIDSVESDFNDLKDRVDSVESDFNDLEERVEVLEDITTWKLI